MHSYIMDKTGGLQARLRAALLLLQSPDPDNLKDRDIVGSILEASLSDLSEIRTTFNEEKATP
ncbi:hypothetical protein ABWI01_03290 [Oceanicaulis alexandrii]|uniref:hypothetical protein n=1 Tax=Oceanicaulis alexandrii TaxID=153233 RepID=UPI0035D0A2E7